MEQALLGEDDNVSHKNRGVDDSEMEAEVGMCCRLCACRPRWSGNIKTLITVIILFSVVSIAQLVGSVMSSSLALLGDSISMGIDTLTFCGNLYAECSTSKHRVTIQLTASGLSLLALSLFTVSVIVEAVDRLMYSDKVEVDPYIVLGFSFVGLCFDVIGFVAYYYWGSDFTDPNSMHDKTIQDTNADHNNNNKSSSSKNNNNNSSNNNQQQLVQVVKHGVSDGDGIDKDKNNGFGGEYERQSEQMEVEIELGRINMCSALMHVASDALRSITTLIEGFLILYTDLDSENTDAVASLIVSTIIVIGTVGALISWAQQVMKHCRGELISRPSSSAGDRLLENKSNGSAALYKKLENVATDSTSYQQHQAHSNGFGGGNRQKDGGASRYQAILR